MGKRYEAPAGEPGAMGGGSQGRYIKADDSGEVYVVSTVFWNLESDPPSWLDKESFAVQKHKSISVTHEKPEDSFTLFREEEGGDLKLKDAIEGKELDTGATGGIGGAFSSASFVDVLTGEAKAEDKTGLDKPVNVDIETFEDFKYAVRVGKKNDDSRYPLTFTVSADLPEKREVEDGVEETEEEKKSRDEAFEKEQTRLKEKLEKETALAGNVYLVESWAVERVLKKKDELYKKEEDKKGAANNNTGTTATTPPIQVPLRPPESTDGSKPKEKITATTPPISVKDAIEKAKKDAEKKAAEAAEKEGADASKDDPAKKLEEELKKAVEEKKDGADTTSEAKPDGDGGEAVKETEETTKESGE